MSHIPSEGVFRKARSVNLRSAPGFTLVELLVVIGIIAVLIAILLPALSQARSTATNLVCVTRLRQIAQAIFLYQQDNHGRYPICTSNGINVDGANSRATWCNYFLNPYLGNKPSSTGAYQDSSLMRCPADDRGPLDMTQTNGWGNSSYMMLDLNGTATLTGSGNSNSWVGGQTISHGGMIEVYGLVGGSDASGGGQYVTNPPVGRYPRGDNPYIIEGTAAAFYHMNGVQYARVQHGIKYTKMNYITMDLSVMQVDFKNSSYQYYLPFQGLVYGDNNAKNWDRACGSQSTPWSATNPTQTSSSQGGAYILGFPYGSAIQESGNLTHAITGYKY